MNTNGNRLSAPQAAEVLAWTRARRAFRAPPEGTVPGSAGHGTHKREIIGYHGTAGRGPQTPPGQPKPGGLVFLMLAASAAAALVVSGPDLSSFLAGWHQFGEGIRSLIR